MANDVYAKRFYIQGVDAIYNKLAVTPDELRGVVWIETTYCDGSKRMDFLKNERR